MAKGQEARSQEEKIGSDFEEKVVFINRCAKVVKGGRRFSFSALILVGDRNGKVGYGFAKANEVSDAIHKATEAAKKNVFTFEMEGTTIPHEIHSKWDGVSLLLKPASAGRGMVAGSKVRAFLELAGIRDVIAKSRGSNCPLNQIRATADALQKLRSREKSKEERGVK